jgi:hypothetical protein
MRPEPGAAIAEIHCRFYDTVCRSDWVFEMHPPGFIEMSNEINKLRFGTKNA